MSQPSFAFRIIRWYLAGMALVGVAQLLPIPGIFLMMMLGSVWISVILNAMLIHLAIAAVVQKIDRGWLAVPTVIYGGWIAIIAAQAIYIHYEVGRLEALNRLDVAIATDTPLVFEDNDRLAVAAKKFIRGGPVFYANHEIVIDSRTNGEDACSVDSKVGEQVLGHLPGKQCVLSRVNAGPHRGLHFRSQSGMKRLQSAYILALDSDDGTIQEVGYFGFGSLVKLKPLPFFWLGCALNGGRAAWECGFSPMFTYVGYGGGSFGSSRDQEMIAQRLADLMDRKVQYIIQRHYPLD